MARPQAEKVQRRRCDTSLSIEASEGFQARILAELSELKGKVDESLEQGRECNTDLKLLRKELGIDGPHGRLPIVEAAVARHEEQISQLESDKIEMRTRHQLLHSLFAVCGGGLGGTLITILSRLFGGH